MASIRRNFLRARFTQYAPVVCAARSHACSYLPAPPPGCAGRDNSSQIFVSFRFSRLSLQTARLSCKGELCRAQTTRARAPRFQTGIEPSYSAAVATPPHPPPLCGSHSLQRQQNGMLWCQLYLKVAKFFRG